MDKHEQFKHIYKKFIDGTHWLNKRMVEGIATQEDKDLFMERVAGPMDALWAEMTDDEKEYWSTVSDAVQVFNGTIVVGESRSTQKKKERQIQRKKDRGKRWKKYFQQC
ncbi:hypothetical protein M0R36_04180 [bacterium]|jgi:hypothetical protein|nr:hypothetical protein [bacterium]